MYYTYMLRCLEMFIKQNKEKQYRGKNNVLHIYG